MIKDNIANIRERVVFACSKAKTDISKVAVIAVSKTRTVKEIEEVVDCGITDLGENRIQEAGLKYKQVQAVKWHMLGHLQTNKVKRALEIFDLIQSVDSLRLVKEINSQAEKINKVQDILIEIKTSPELSKTGLSITEASLVIEEAFKLKNIKIKGLMTIAPLVATPEEARPYFRVLREFRDKINKDFILSMGMSDDFQIAIEEGSNMIRIGRAIFES